MLGNLKNEVKQLPRDAFNKWRRNMQPEPEPQKDDSGHKLLHALNAIPRQTLR